jgi:intein/homing endonuclease
MSKGSKNSGKIKISPLLDEKAYDVAKFIKELGIMQYKYFDDFVKFVKEEKLIQGLSNDELHDWLSDYIFNSNLKDALEHHNSDHPTKKFSEHLKSHDCLMNHYDL